MVRIIAVDVLCNGVCRAVAARIDNKAQVLARVLIADSVKPIGGFLNGERLRESAVRFIQLNRSASRF